MLGRIVESVSGVSYRQFLTDRIFKPCGMQSSTTTSQTGSKLGRARSAVYRVRFAPITLFAHLVLDSEGRIEQMALKRDASIDDGA